jgi:hypothetical protein
MKLGVDFFPLLIPWELHVEVKIYYIYIILCNVLTPLIYQFQCFSDVYSPLGLCYTKIMASPLNEVVCVKSVERNKIL